MRRVAAIPGLDDYQVREVQQILNCPLIASSVVPSLKSTRSFQRKKRGLSAPLEPWPARRRSRLPPAAYPQKVTWRSGQQVEDREVAEPTASSWSSCPPAPDKQLWRSQPCPHLSNTPPVRLQPWVRGQETCGSSRKEPSAATVTTCGRQGPSIRGSRQLGSLQ